MFQSLPPYTLEVANRRADFFCRYLLKELLPKCAGEPFLVKYFLNRLLAGSVVYTMPVAIKWSGDSDYVTVDWSRRYCPYLRDVRIVEVAASELGMLSGSHCIGSDSELTFGCAGEKVEQHLARARKLGEREAAE